MTGDDGDAVKRAERRKRDAASARRRRADRRAALEGPVADDTATPGDGVGDATATQNVGGDGVSATSRVGQNVVYLPVVRQSDRLEKALIKLDHALDVLDADRSVPLETKVRYLIAAIGAFAKGVEALELRDRLEALERLNDALRRRGRL